MYPIEINLTPDQVRKIIANFLGIAPGHSKIEFNLEDVSGEHASYPRLGLSSVKVSTDDITQWGFNKKLQDIS